MKECAKWYVKTADGKVYGPTDMDCLVEWTKEGRVSSTALVSSDQISWMPASLIPQLEMKWVVETEPGNVFGPFNRALVIRLFRNREIPETARAYRLHELAIDMDPPVAERIVEKEVRVEVPVEKIVEKEVIKEVRVEVPVEKIVEKEVIKEVRVEVPVERIVEKEVIREVRVEVPVEKIVEKEVIVEVPVERVIEVMPPGGTADPGAMRTAGGMPQAKSPGALFDNVGRDRLAALEAAARRELAAAKRHGGGISFGLFGDKRR